MDIDSQSIGSNRNRGIGLPGVAVNDEEDARSQRPVKGQGLGTSKKRKKKEPDGAQSQDLGGVRRAVATGDRLEDLDDAEVIKAYDNVNLSASQWDNASQSSAGRRSLAGGNGNPNGLPGLGGGPGRARTAAPGLDRAHSVSSASVERMSQVRYEDPGPPRQGSSSMILEEEPPAVAHGKQSYGISKQFPMRPSDASGLHDQTGYTNATQGDRLLNSDASLLQLNNSTATPGDQELTFKRGAPQGYAQQPFTQYGGQSLGVGDYNTGLSGHGMSQSYAND